MADDVAAVLDETPCRRCQYNLMGLAIAGLCPECGTRVALSIGDDRLCRAEPAWVATVRVGVNVLFWATVTLVGATLFIAFVLPGLRYGLASLLIPAGFGVAFIVGQWVVTTPDPGGLGEDRYGTARRVVRLTAAAGAVKVVVNFAQRTTHLPPPAHLAITLAAQALDAIGVVGTGATVHYLGKLAGRIPDGKLARRARWLQFGLGVPLACMWVYGAAVTAATLTGNRAVLRGWPTSIMGWFALLLAGFGLAYLVFLAQLSNRLADQAAAAERAWSPGWLAPASPPP